MQTTVIGNKEWVIVRGAGDIATGTIVRLHRCGFSVIALEVGRPTVIRRTVSFAPAIIHETAEVEGLRARHCVGSPAILKALSEGEIPVCVDSQGDWIRQMKPLAVVDAILAKENLGTTRDMAPIVVGLGPGFTAGEDVDAVVETARGHNLGRVIYEGPAAANTGIPGNIGGYTHERVIHAPATGIITLQRDIGDLVKAGERLAVIGGVPVYSKLDGVLRGMIADGTSVLEGMKIADVDPRGVLDHCFSISDKARSVSGGVLEAIMTLRRNL